AGGREQGIRIVCDQRRETGLGGGRNLGDDGAAQGARKRKRAQGGGADMRVQRPHGLGGERGLGPAERGRRRGGAAVRGGGQRAGQRLEWLAGQVEDGAGSRGAVVGERPRTSLGGLDEAAHRIGGYTRMHRHKDRGGSGHCYRGEILLGVEGQLRINTWIND